MEKKNLFYKMKSFFEKNGRMALLLLFVLELLLMIFITPNKFDDEFFLNKAIEGHTFEYLIDRYNTWTSRVVLEFVLIVLFKISKVSWMVLQALMVTLIGYSLSKIFIKDNKKELNFMLVSMILIYPLNVMASAGWATTTTVYTWPLALGLYALIPIKRIWNGEKMTILQYCLSSLAILYAADNEQVCALLLGFYLLYTVIMIFKDKKIHPYMIVQCLIIIGCMIFILTCPGNYVRKSNEIERYFQDMEMYTVLDKVALGFTSTMGLIIGEETIVFILMSSIINIYVFTHYKERIYRIVSILPLISVIILGLLVGPENPDLLGRVFPFMYSFRTLLVSQEVFLTASTCNNLLYATPLIFSMIFFICTGMSILLLYNNLKDNVPLLLYLAGLASRIIIGFSPTIFASGARTMIFFEFAMISIAIITWQKIIKDNKVDKKLINKAEIAIKFTAVVQYLNVLFCILFTQK